VLKKLKLWEDVERAKKRKTVRAGKGTKRGRRYKRAKSILIVTGEKSELAKSSRNIEGLEVTNARNLNTKLLAPGATAGRLTLWTENAIKELSEKK
jgi:large subunit ribosomal protein L4e